MPKHQSTAAKAARAKAKAGGKYTAALRDADRRDAVPEVSRAAAIASLDRLIGDPALDGAWRPVLTRLRQDAVDHQDAVDRVRAMTGLESWNPTYTRACQRRYAALCRYGTRAVAVLQAVADGRAPDGDGALQGEDAAVNAVTGEPLMPDEDQVDIPRGVQTPRPCTACRATGTMPAVTAPDGTVMMGPTPCVFCTDGISYDPPAILDRAWDGFAEGLVARREYDDAFRNDEDRECFCADDEPDGRCICDPYYIPEHLIGEADRLEEEMSRWPEALAHYADAVAVALAGELRARLTRAEASR